MNTLVDFRSKYLGFDRPLYLPYHKADFPRHYSTFDRRYDAGWPNTTCDLPPEHYPVKFPIKYEDINICPAATFSEISMSNYTWVLVLFILLFLVVWTKKR